MTRSPYRYPDAFRMEKSRLTPKPTRGKMRGMDANNTRRSRWRRRRAGAKLMGRFDWIRHLNPWSWLRPWTWLRKSDAEVVSDIANRAVSGGSTNLTEDECGSVERWAKDYAAAVKAKKESNR